MNLVFDFAAYEQRDVLNVRVLILAGSSAFAYQFDVQEKEGNS